MTNMSMNCRDDNRLASLSISVTISNVRILFLKHFKVVTSLTSGDNFPQRLGPKWRRECLPYVTVLYLAAKKSDCLGKGRRPHGTTIL